MNDDQLLRYSRQIMLPSIGVEGQQRLLDSHVLIVGLGGLGAPVAMYLAAAGVGRLTLADFDKVDLTNLQRQIIHGTEDIGQAKVVSAKQSLEEINPEVEIECLDTLLDERILEEQVEKADAVVDCTDNFLTRFAINAASVATGTPLVSGAAIRLEGQVTVFSGRKGGPCYQCLSPADGHADETCSENGVLAPVVGVIGSIQATETLKVLTGAGESLTGRLLLFDALHMEWRSLKLSSDPGCPVCGITGAAVS